MEWGCGGVGVGVRGPWSGGVGALEWGCGRGIGLREA